MEKKSIFSDFAEINMKMSKAILNRYKKLNLKVTPLQSRIIMYLYNNEGVVCQKELIKYIGCNKSTLSSVLSTMEKNGFILREGNLEDIRKNKILLTSRSLEIVDILEKDHDEIDKILETNISEKELETFRMFMEKLKINLERI